MNNPLSPAATVPGGPAFTLTVNGAGFVSGSTVSWNGSPRSTSFVSPTQLSASILASDIAATGTAYVTVSNPAPGGGVSNAVLFEVTASTASLTFNRTDTTFSLNGVPTIYEPTGMAFGYNPVDATHLFAVASAHCPPAGSCLPQQSTVSTVADSGPSLAPTDQNPGSLILGDFNGDGLLDFITLGAGISVSLGNAAGNFNAPNGYPLPAGALASSAPVVGDFNRDGRLDLIIAGNSQVFFFPGNGDGSFGAPVAFATGAPAGATQLAAGDYNGDGILDLAVTNEMGNSVSILLGNGDGTFLHQVDYPTGSLPGAIVSGDFNGDGMLDLAVLNQGDATVLILLGNGDGTFRANGAFPAGVSPVSLSLGDYNGDGKLDLVVADTQCTNAGCPPSGSANVLLGNGDGTFQSHLDFATGGLPGSVVTADFNLFYSPPSAGRAGFAVANYADNTVSVFTALPSQGGPGNPIPAISSISPAFVVQDSGAFTLAVNGGNFVSGSTISFGGQTQPTTFISSTQLTASIPATASASVGPVSVLVSSPAPGGGNSAPNTFNVYLPPPVISSLNPSSAIAGSPAFTLTINGSNFVSGSTVSFNGSPRSSTFVSPTQLTTAVAASEVLNQGAINVTVTNPFGVDNAGGGASSAATLAVVPANSQPTIGALAPASTTAGGPAFTLTITGSGFGPSSVVTFGGVNVSSAYQNPAELQAAIPAGAIAVAGTPLVAVANPGGNPSVVVSFTVNNPLPAATGLSPGTVAAGSAAVSLSVAGANFVPGSAVLVNGGSRATTFVSANSLTASLPASDFAHSGTLTITVSNPSPGGGSAGTLALIVADYSVSAASLTTTVSAGQPAIYNLTLTPTNGALGGAVAFSASGIPTGAAASFAPPTVAAGSAASGVKLSIATAPHSPFSSRKLPNGKWPDALSRYEFALAIMTMLAVLGTNRRGPTRRFALYLQIVLLLAVAARLVACGAGGTSSPGPQLDPTTGTPAGTYTISVNATSGNATLTTRFTLTVN